MVSLGENGPIQDTYTVFIIDDHEVVVEGIKSFLNDRDQFVVVGSALDPREGVEQVKRLMPDIVIMDISMPGMNGLQATLEIKKFAPEANIVIYSMFADSECTLELFRAGISAYILKDGPILDLLKALNAVKEDATYYRTIAPKSVSSYLQKEKGGTDDIDLLSEREGEIFRLLADGHSVKSIADRLSISRKTVETHKYHIMSKLKTDNLIDLTKLAIKKNLIKV